MDDERDEIFANLIEEAFVRAGASPGFLTSALFDQIQLKLLGLIQHCYCVGYNDGMAYANGDDRWQSGNGGLAKRTTIRSGRVS